MRRILFPLLALALALPGCTVVKPVACALGYPVREVGRRIDRPSEDEPGDLPAPVVIAALPVLFPINYAYWTLHGAAGGLFSGLVNDLQWITGHGSLERGWETMLDPLKTNAVPGE